MLATSVHAASSVGRQRRRSASTRRARSPSSRPRGRSRNSASCFVELRRRRSAAPSASGLRDSTVRYSERDPVRRRRPALGDHPLGQRRGRPRSAARRSSAAAPAAACCCGRGRRTTARGSGASKFARNGGGAVRLRNTYRLRRYSAVAVVLQVVPRVAVRRTRPAPRCSAAGTASPRGRPSSRFDQPADEQRVVADLLGVEPEPRAAGEQPVLRVLRAQLRRRPRDRAGTRRTSPAAARASSCPSRCRGTRRRASRAVPGGSAARPASRSRRSSSPARCRRTAARTG